MSNRKPGFLHGRKAMRTTINLPIPPSVNAIWSHAKGGRVFRSAQYVSWQHEAGYDLKGQHPPKFAGCVAVRIRAGIVEKRRDLDNLAKALLDLLQAHGVVENDADVATIELRWDRTVPAGRVEVEVRTSLPPAWRSTAETRARIAAANARRAGSRPVEPEVA